jgi:hypothetical protein
MATEGLIRHKSLDIDQVPAQIVKAGGRKMDSDVPPPMEALRSASKCNTIPENNMIY